ncbi:ecto-NOX disulfide-thiol exchanger 2-like [Watersipora subatra]|uniref:ecto-NOX disulfide-thiol exchanger 2-like n=1 Tax=Watersipora subatra TaxID=2589382 RepID=UPI00355B7EA3
MDDRMNQPLDFDHSKGRPPIVRNSREERIEKQDNARSCGNIPGSVDMDMVENGNETVTSAEGNIASGHNLGPGMNMTGGGQMNLNTMGPMNMHPGMMMGPRPIGASHMGMMNHGQHMGMLGNGQQMGVVVGPMNQMGGAINQIGGAMNPMPGFSGDMEFMMGDPSLVGRPHEVDGKEILHFKGFILVPPPPNSAPRSTREKPPGCKTVFVGGLPETVTEDMIGELLQTCGNIETIRLGKKFFAHIRFDSYDAVDKAIFYSGWRMKIGDKDDKPNTGRIHCDYATARDDQYEYECMQRAIEREQRHQRIMLAEMNRPPSPPRVARFSESEANNVTDMLKSSNGFTEAAHTLSEWMEKGQVTGRNANRFYTMLHSVNSTVRRLTGEKEQFEEELQNYKAQYKTKVTGLLSQMDQIENVFAKARQQRVWDHFSKPQRRNVELWTKVCQDLKQKHNDELLADREEDEMDLSDTEDGMPTVKKAKLYSGEMNSLQDENDSLKCQLEAYKNELDMSKHEGKSELEQKNTQITLLQQTLRGMQEQLLSTRNEVIQLQRKFDDAKEPEKATGETETPKPAAETEKAEANQNSPTTFSIEPTPCTRTINEGDARLLGLIVCFLHVHPFGASMDYIWSYLQRGGLPTKSSALESLLEAHPTMFAQKFVGVGLNLEKRWTFIGFPPGTSS